MNDFIELNKVIRIVLRRIWFLVLLTATAALAGYEISRSQTPVYEATTTVLVGQVTQSTNLSNEDIQMSELLAQTYADLALRQPVLQGVVVKLNLTDTWQDLITRVHVKFIDGTQLIEIKAEASSSEMARIIADEVANQLILLGPTNLSDSEENIALSFVHQQMEDTKARILSGQKRITEIDAMMGGSIAATKMSELQIEKTTLEKLIADNVMNYVDLSNLAGQDKKPNSLSIIETAHSENNPIRPRTTLNVLLSSGLGMLLALGIIFIWEYKEDAIKSTDDLSQFKELNILGTVRKVKGENGSNGLFTQLDPSSAAAASYRRIGNKLRFSSVDNPPKSIVIISPEADEGRSFTAANLGIIMAQSNMKTVIVDANLRHPGLHHAFNVKIKSGLVDLIDLPKTDLTDCLKSTSINNLQIITSGELSQDHSKQLSSKRISEILRCLEEKADVIIIDSPPALQTTDATILSNQADGVILDIRAGKSKVKEIRQTLVDLQEANACLLGCIFN